MSHYFNPPSLLCVPDAQGASTSSVSSQHPRGSDFTDPTSLTRPINSAESIFGNDPELPPFDCFSDPVASWEGLTFEQWKLHVLGSKAEYAIREAEKGISEDLLLHKDDGFYGQSYEFDAVAAVRARLMRSKPTAITKRALEIIGRRSRPWLTAGDNDRLAGKAAVVDATEEIEDYAEDMELGDQDAPVRLLTASFFLPY
jgi:hypothetical protein